VVWLLFSEFCLVVSKIFGLLFCPEIWGDDPMLTNSMFQVFQVSGKTNTKLVSPCFLFDVHSVMSSMIFLIFLVHVRTLPTAFSRTWSGAELFQRTPVKSQFTSHLKTNISPKRIVHFQGREGILGRSSQDLVQLLISMVIVSPLRIGLWVYPFHPWPNFMAFKWGWSRTSILTGMMLQVIPSELCGNRRMLEHYPRWNAAASTSTEGWKRRIFC